MYKTSLRTLMAAALLSATLACQSKKSETPASTEVAADSSAQVAQGPFGKFEFEEEEFDFGTIKEGDVVSHVFKFKNTGEAPLVITNATASCGCTVPQKPEAPVEVGQMGEIVVEFNSKGKKEQQSKTITLTANTDPQISKLLIKAYVEPKTEE